jgi:hypothetical protein
MDDPEVRRERKKERGEEKEGEKGGYRHKKQDKTKEQNRDNRCSVCVVQLGWVDDDGLEMQTSF